MLRSSFKYPYDPNDQGREDLKAPDDVYRVLRGGSCFLSVTLVQDPLNLMRLKELGQR